MRGDPDFDADEDLYSSDEEPAPKVSCTRQRTQSMLLMITVRCCAISPPCQNFGGDNGFKYCSLTLGLQKPGAVHQAGLMARHSCTPPAAFISSMHPAALPCKSQAAGSKAQARSQATSRTCQPQESDRGGAANSCRGCADRGIQRHHHARQPNS